MSIRCFIAIELDQQIQQKLSLLQGQFRRQLRGQDQGIKWVDSQALHLTLKFLGDVEDQYIPEVCKVVSETAGQFEPFEFDVVTVGCFPPQGAARGLWAGIQQGTEPMAQLQRAIDQGLHQIGFDLDRRKYTAHLTLARIKNSATGSLIQDLVSVYDPIPLGIQQAREVKVMQSTLTRSGPTYTCMATAKLGDRK